MLNVDAEEFIARSRKRFDVILVDIYDGGGFARVAGEFWDHAMGRLADKGCLAVNWADPDKSDIYRTHALYLAGSAPAGCYVTARGFKDNVVQLASFDPEFSVRRLRRASTALHKELRRRDVLNRCAILDTLP